GGTRAIAPSICRCMWRRLYRRAGRIWEGGGAANRRHAELVSASTRRRIRRRRIFLLRFVIDDTALASRWMLKQVQHDGWSEMMFRRMLIGLMVAAATPAIAAPSLQDATVSATVAAMKPGDFIWAPNVAPSGPVV